MQLSIAQLEVILMLVVVSTWCGYHERSEKKTDLEIFLKQSVNKIKGINPANLKGKRQTIFISKSNNVTVHLP